MPYLVDTCFREFYSAINLPGDHRTVANERLSNVVGHLKELNIIESFASGSIPRYTAVSGHADLDAIIVLHYSKHIKDRKPSQVLQLVRDQLSKYSTNLRRNGQAVTLYYNDWPNVDVVPVSKVSNNGELLYYEVPNMRTETWLRSRPKLHSINLKERAGSAGEKFRQVITMVKFWNFQNSRWLQSYHIEAAAMESIHSDDTYSWLVYYFFQKLHQAVQGTLYYLGDSVDDYLTWERRRVLSELLAGVANKAQAAWYCTHNGGDSHQEAIKIWGEIFGSKFPKYG